MKKRPFRPGSIGCESGMDVVVRESGISYGSALRSRLLANRRWLALYLIKH